MFMRPSGSRSTRSMRAVQPTRSGTAGSPTSRPLRMSSTPNTWSVTWHAPIMTL
jgi:hypothetical protein